MYERSLERNLVWIKTDARFSLFFDFLFYWFCFDFFDSLIFLYGIIYPVIDGNSPFCILLYFIGQLKTWHLTLSEYIMEGRSTNAELFCYATLLLIITLHPFCEFVHPITFFISFSGQKCGIPIRLGIYQEKEFTASPFEGKKKKC